MLSSIALAGCAITPGPRVDAAHFIDCNPALAARMIEDGALVVEVKADGAISAVPGALALPPGDVASRVAREPRARCGVVILSEGGWSGSATIELRRAGYDATDLGELGAWRYVPRRARDVLASGARPCTR